MVTRTIQKKLSITLITKFHAIKLLINTQELLIASKIMLECTSNQAANQFIFLYEHLQHYRYVNTGI